MDKSLQLVVNNYISCLDTEEVDKRGNKRNSRETMLFVSKSIIKRPNL